MHENVFSSGIWLNEAITLLLIEPFHSTCRHVTRPSVLTPQ
jgi:hypothetical protein